MSTEIIISWKVGLSAIAMVMTFIAFVPYVRDIVSGSTRPHVFSWVIWSISTLVTFLAQLQDGGGAGAWPNGLSGAITLWIALLAYQKRGDINITLSDWLFFAAALSSLPLWYLTADPLWAVVILTIVDLLGFAPTIRKTYRAPYSESILFYGLFVFRNGLTLLALEHYSLTTILFPAAVAIACVGLIVMMAYRRRLVSVAVS